MDGLEKNPSILQKDGSLGEPHGNVVDDNGTIERLAQALAQDLLYFMPFNLPSYMG